MPPIKLTYEFDTIEEVRAHLGGEMPVAPTIEEPGDPEPTRDDTDADGMPWDEAVHSDPPSFTADGLWRAKRGKAEEAKKARADFKAGGGNEEPPVVETQTREEPISMPGMPGGVDDAPAPVSFEQVMEKAGAALESKQIDRAGLMALYVKTAGVENTTPEQIAAAAGQVYFTNETARAALMAELQKL